MHIVAVDNLGEDRDRVARALADALGMVLYDVLVRVRAPGRGPLIITACAGEELASEKAGKLRDAGFRAFVIGPHEVESDNTRIIVRRFSLGDSGLSLEERAGGPVSIAYERVGVIIRGIRVTRSSETETSKERKFDAGMAVLTGGLVATKSTRIRQETVTEVRENFIHLYPGDQRPVVFLESAVQFESLGPLLQPSRSANFALLTAELKRRCSRAVFDDRLLNKAAQSRLLGPMLAPEKYLDLAITLLSRSLRS